VKLTYAIIDEHADELILGSTENEGSEFIIQLLSI